MELRVVETDEDYEAWRAVRIAVVPGERTQSVEEMRATSSPGRLLVVASVDGVVVGSGIGDRSHTAESGFVMPRVLPEHRRRGVGTTLLHALSDHCAALGLPAVVTSVDDEGALAFAQRFGFEEVDREVEQLYAVGDVPPPGDLPPGVEVVTAQDHPGLWEEAYATFGTEVLADFALYAPLQVDAAEWASPFADPSPSRLAR